MTTWANRADAVIAQVDRELPTSASLQERRAALRKVAHDYHGGTSWGQKVWGKRVRLYLERHGQQHRQLRDQPSLPADILFPWRDQ